MWKRNGPLLRVRATQEVRDAGVRNVFAFRTTSTDIRVGGDTVRLESRDWSTCSGSRARRESRPTNQDDLFDFYLRDCAWDDLDAAGIAYY